MNWMLPWVKEITKEYIQGKMKTAEYLKALKKIKEDFKNNNNQ